MKALLVGAVPAKLNDYYATVRIVEYIKGRAPMQHRLLLSISLLVSALSLQAQVEQARITGTVRDATGAVIPQGRLSMIHEDTNVEHVAETNQLGSYVSVPLRVG